MTNIGDENGHDVAGSPKSVWVRPGLWIALVVMMPAAVSVNVCRALSQDSEEAGFHLPPVVRGAGFNFDHLTVPAKRILSGGPPKDGIPSLTNPRVVPVREADFMQDGYRVIGVTVNGESRAYPVNMLNSHECINDKLGGVPIAVIYCPLCDSASVVDRRLGQQVLEFGISGRLLNSNVLLYDRTNNALWTQVGLQAISGPNAGRSLVHLNEWSLMRFVDWCKVRPASTVVSFEGRRGDRYHRNPYAERGYFTNDAIWFPVEPEDLRMPRKTLVIGVKAGDLARAYVVRSIMTTEEGQVRDRIGDGVIELRADAETGEVTVRQAPEDAQVVHTFWFAWYAFHPETEIWGLPGAHPGFPGDCSTAKDSDRTDGLDRQGGQ